MISEHFSNHHGGGDEGEELANFQKDITYLNSLLTKQSLQPRPMRQFIESYATLSTAIRMEVAGLVDLAFCLLSSKNRDSNFRQDYEERIQRAAEETRRLEQENSRLSLLATQRESELESMAQKLREAQRKIAELEGSQQVLREDLLRSKSSFGIKEKQFTHELRKRDKEYERLREQLARTGGESIKLVDAAGSEHVGAQRPEQTAIKIRDPAEHDEPSEQGGISRIGELETENINLRNLIVGMAQALWQIRQNAAIAEIDDATAEHPQPLSINNLPAEWIYDQVREDLEASLADIGDRLRRMMVVGEEF